MKTTKKIFLKTTFTVAFMLLVLTGCEVELSDQKVEATFPKNGDVFLDNFSAGLNYFPFVDGGADPDAFSVVTDEVYQGSSSMRFDVPSFGKGFVGATFNTTSARDLSSFDALTFYAKASKGATINSVGFGIDGETKNKYMVTLENLPISTKWEKYTIPIPNATRLKAEKGLFWLAEGASFEGDEGGYVFWIDEVKFEKLGTIGQSRPKILGGFDSDFISIPSQILNIGQLKHISNLENGTDVTTTIMPSYFDFDSSDTNIATVNESGELTVKSIGEAKVTAKLNGVTAKGSVNVKSFSEPRIISIFSDLYANITVDGFNGFWGFSTTLGGAINEGGNNIINYTALNFVGMEFYGRYGVAQPVNATTMTHLNFDVRVNENVDPGDFIRIELINSVNSGQTSGTFTIPSNKLSAGNWVPISIPFTNFSGGLARRNSLGILVVVSDGTISNVSFDNIFFSKQ